MAGDVRTRLRFQAVRGATNASRTTTSGDLLVGASNDFVKYTAVEKEQVRRAIVFVVTADTAATIDVQLIRANTIDQALTGGTTIDSILIPTTHASGQGYYKDMSPASGDMDPGEQFVFRAKSGQVAGGSNYFLECWVIVEPKSEADANLPYPQRMNKSS